MTLTNAELAQLAAEDDAHDARIDALDRAAAILDELNRAEADIHARFVAECARTTAAFDAAMQ